MNVVFATNNNNKLAEVQAMLGGGVKVLSLSDIGCHVDIPETGATLEDNALIKARYVWEHYHTPCFADDTGLEVSALGGAPGVYSARYAGGEGHDSEANMAKLLSQLSGATDRSARFRTVIALIEGDNAEPLLFEGIVNGSITEAKSGAEGFGYDPVFMPEGYDKTFAELGSEVKNKISHRARAVSKLVNYLSK